MKVLVIDPFQTGHHLIYLYHITEAFLKNGATVVSAGNINEEFENKFESLVRQYDNNLSYTKLVDKYGGYYDKSTSQYTEVIKERWMVINDLVDSLGSDFDFVFLPWIDSYIDGRIESEFYNKLLFKWVGIYFQPYFINKMIISIDRYKFLDPSILFAHKSCIGLGSLVDSDAVREHFLFKDKPVYFIPDFADMDINEVKDFGEEIRLKSNNRFTLGIYGSLAKRKGIMQLFQTIEKYNLYDSCFFIVAGEFIDSDFSSKERNYLLNIVNNNNESFFFHPERLDSEAEFNYLMSLCDVVFAAYKNFFYSSNMLIKSASLNKPLIVTKNTYMGDEVEKYQLGLTVEMDEEKIFGAIKEILCDADKVVDKEKVKEFVAKQSIGELEKVISTMLMNSAKGDA